MKQWKYNEEAAASPQVVAYRDLTPHTVEPSQALVTLNIFVTLVALGGTVPLHPKMMHYLRREGERQHTGREGGEKRNMVQKNKMHTSDTANKESKEEKNKHRGQKRES